MIITGAGHGLGRAYALACAAEGASVTLADLDAQSAEDVAAVIRRTGGHALALQTDVTDADSVARMVDATAARFGGVDGLVNNAAMQAVVPMSRVSFDRIPDMEWDAMFATNVKGTWHCCRAVTPFLRVRGGGSIVNIGSNVSILGAPMRAHYVASKSAIIGLTRSLAREIGTDFIRVNAVAPGSVLSEEQPSSQVLAMRRRFAADQAMPRILEAPDIVGTVVFLLSDASRYLTGQTIVVDAGAVLP